MGEKPLLISGIVIFVLILIMDSICYAFKSAFDNVSVQQVSEEAQGGSKRAKLLTKMLTNQDGLDNTLSFSILITTFMAGTMVHRWIGDPIIKQHNSSIWVSIAIALVILILISLFGFMIPKKCAARKPYKTACALVYIIRAVTIIFMPFGAVITLLRNLILGIFGISAKDDDEAVTEAAIINMVSEGQEQGTIEQDEAEMINNIFQLDDKCAGDVMTHRSVVVALDAHMKLEDVVKQYIDGKFSRFPVYDEDIDHIVGTLHIRDALILYRVIPNRKKEISAIRNLLRPAYYVPETRDIDELLKDMQKDKVHLGVVVDEYGQTAGIITMEDIIEEIVGNILDEYDEEEEAVSRGDEGSYILDGFTTLDELNELLGSSFKSEDYETLNGLVISLLGSIPTQDNVGETYECEEYSFTILEVAGNVIKKAEVAKKVQPAEETTGEI